jgi:hypothetical protein
MSLNSNKMVEEEALKAHNFWLEKAKTAKIDGVEMTVLPYGYLRQAVEKALNESQQKIRTLEEVGEKISECRIIKVSEDINIAQDPIYISRKDILLAITSLKQDSGEIEQLKKII